MGLDLVTLLSLIAAAWGGWTAHEHFGPEPEPVVIVQGVDFCKTAKPIIYRPGQARQMLDQGNENINDQAYQHNRAIERLCATTSRP